MADDGFRDKAREINARDMKEVLEEHGIEVKRKGAGYVALCPWHDDHHPSLVVYEHTCWCPVCMDHRKSVIDTLMYLRKQTFREVVGKEGSGPSPRSPIRGRAGGRWGEREWGEREWGEREWGEREWEEAKKEGDKKGKSFNYGNYLRIEDIYSICNVSTSSSSMSSSSMSSSSHRAPALPLTGERGEGLGVGLGEGLFDCSLAKCMKSRFHPALVDKVVEDYRLVCYSHFGSDDDTLFPNIDSNGHVHNVKLQRYETDRRSERFFHADKKYTYWMGAIWKRQGRIPEDSQIDMDCLFGEHLLAERPNSDVVLVESPKNAVVGSAACPQYVWLATGAKGMLTRDRLLCLRNRHVIVIPDTDAIEDWRRLLNGMQDIASFVISSLTDEIRKIGDKADVADWVVETSPSPLALPRGGGSR